MDFVVWRRSGGCSIFTYFSFDPADCGAIDRANETLVIYHRVNPAGMVELVDTPDLGSGGESRGSSSLSTRTK